MATVGSRTVMCTKRVAPCPGEVSTGEDTSPKDAMEHQSWWPSRMSSPPTDGSLKESDGSRDQGKADEASPETFHVLPATCLSEDSSHHPSSSNVGEAPSGIPEGQALEKPSLSALEQNLCPEEIQAPACEFASIPTPFSAALSSPQAQAPGSAGAARCLGNDGQGSATKFPSCSAPSVVSRHGVSRGKSKVFEDLKHAEGDPRNTATLTPAPDEAQSSALGTKDKVTEVQAEGSISQGTAATKAVGLAFEDGNALQSKIPGSPLSALSAAEMEDLGEEEAAPKSAACMLSAAALADGGMVDMEADACSICLESFTASDPAVLTNCNHEYHIQCLLEWAQRKEECPMCWQALELSDPCCQELLDACARERNERAAAVQAQANLLNSSNTRVIFVRNPHANTRASRHRHLSPWRVSSTSLEQQAPGSSHRSRSFFRLTSRQRSSSVSRATGTTPEHPPSDGVAEGGARPADSGEQGAASVATATPSHGSHSWLKRAAGTGNTRRGLGSGAGSGVGSPPADSITHSCLTGLLVVNAGPSPGFAGLSMIPPVPQVPSPSLSAGGATYAGVRSREAPASVATLFPTVGPGASQGMAQAGEDEGNGVLRSLVQTESTPQQPPEATRLMGTSSDGTHSAPGTSPGSPSHSWRTKLSLRTGRSSDRISLLSQGR